MCFLRKGTRKTDEISSHISDLFNSHVQWLESLLGLFLQMLLPSHISQVKSPGVLRLLILYSFYLNLFYPTASVLTVLVMNFAQVKTLPEVAEEILYIDCYCGFLNSISEVSFLLCS